MSDALRFLVAITGRHKRNGSTRTFYFTDAPFTTLPDDALPDQYFVTRISQATDTSRNIFREGTTQGRSEIALSSIVLHNADRAFDLLQQYDCRRAVVRCGLESETTYAGHAVIASGVIEHLPRFAKPTIEFVLSGARDLLKFPLQQNKYGGTNVLPNGIDGTADIEGREKPWVFGAAKEVPLVCVNTAKLIYHGHDGACDQFLQCKDNGVPLTYNGSYASQADLENDALAPLPGHYKVWAAQSMARLGSSPVGVVTGDVTVGATSADRTRAKAVRAVWEKAGYVADDMLLSDLSAMDTRDPHEVQFCVLDNTTGEAVCDQIAVPDAWWGPNKDGLLRFSPVDKPNATPSVTFTEFSIYPDQIVMEPADDPERGRPLKKQTFQYAKIHNVNKNPAAGLTSAEKEFLAQEYRSVFMEDAAVGVTYENAATRTIATLYATEAGARAALLREFALRKTERYRFTFTARYTLQHAAIDLGDIIGLDYPGFGLKLFGDTIGRAFLVIGIQPNAKARTIQFTVWGNTLLDSNLAVVPSGALFKTVGGTIHNKYFVAVAT